MRRREFLKGALGASAGLAVSGPAISLAGTSFAAGDRIRVAVAGVRGRGNNLLRTFASMKDVDIAYVCDIDEGVLKSRTADVSKGGRHQPAAISDFRRALDDKSVNALVLGTPDHWHAIPTIHACMAGKDVYTEKPDGHNLLEGRAMVAFAKKHERIVQLGTQARSGSHYHEAMEYLRSGKLGKVIFAKAWESAKQGSLGHPKDGEAPKGVDYDTWLGPAPKRAFNRLRFHGNWRWFFDYGSGDLGNDGVHRIDYALWALRTAVEAKGGKMPRFPKAVSSHGGKLYFDDAQEWPDTLMTTYDYGDWLLTYEMRVWNRYPLHGESEGAQVLGDAGSVILGNRNWRAFDERGKQLFQKSGQTNLDATKVHVRNFLDCMRSRKKPAADLETIGHPSSILCHLGNAAGRAGKSVTFDPETYRLGSDDADRFRTRPEYRKPWVLPDISDTA